GAMDVAKKLRSAKVVHHEHSLITITRAVTDTHVEASPDFGETWENLPLAEIVDVEVLKDVPTVRGSYPLVRLLLQEEHPTIEIAALRAQVRALRSGLKRGCACSQPAGHASAGTGAPAG